MRKLSRRHFLRLAAVGAGGALLAACGGSTMPEDAPDEPGQDEPVQEAPAAEPVLITYQSWGNEQKFVSEQHCVVDPFMEQQDRIEVEYSGLAWPQHWQRILTGIAGGDPPDVFRMEFWKAHAYYSRGVCQVLDAYFEAEGIIPEEEFLDIQEQSVYEGKWYGTPRGATGNHIIYYNRDMFDEAGIEWPENTPDWTWEDFLDIAMELTNVTGDIETDVWGFDSSKITNDWNGGQEFAWGWGTDLFDEEYRKSLINTPEAIEGLQWLADLRNEHGVAPQPAQLPEGMGDAFLVGKVAMNQTGGFMINSYKVIEDFDWGIAPIPKGKVRQVAFSKPNATVITAASDHPDEAWELLKFINSEQVNKCEASEGLWPPNLQRVLTSDWFLTREEAPYNMAPTVPGLLCDGQAPQLSPFAAECRSILQNELDPVWLGDATIAEVAPGIEETLNELLASEEPPELS